MIFIILWEVCSLHNDLFFCFFVFLVISDHGLDLWSPKSVPAELPVPKGKFNILFMDEILQLIYMVFISPLFTNGFRKFYTSQVVGGRPHWLHSTIWGYIGDIGVVFLLRDNHSIWFHMCICIDTQYIYIYVLYVPSVFWCFFVLLWFIIIWATVRIKGK